MTATALRSLTLAGVMVCALLVAGPHDAATAQDKISIDDLRIRAENGDKRAGRRLAQAYYLGHNGVKRDFNEAARWYLKLAKQGDARSQTSIGLMYARGYGVRKDVEEARKWWTLAAVQNEPGAQFNLGLLYASGESVTQDYAQAFRWYREAAVRGHVQAQHNLGMLYHEGKGARQDPVRAYYWIAIAARQGDDMAQKSLKTVTAGMTPEQIDIASEKVNAWFRKAK
jgi:hypothetical protein